MESTRQLTAIIEREGDTYVALCPELDIAREAPGNVVANTTGATRIDLLWTAPAGYEIERARSHAQVSACARSPWPDAPHARAELFGSRAILRSSCRSP